MAGRRLGYGDLLQRTDTLVLETIVLLKSASEHCDRLDMVILQQLMKSISSIGANLAEADVAISTKEFIRILYIALREAQESRYWLSLLSKITSLKKHSWGVKEKELDQIIKIMQSIVNKSQK